MKSKMSKKLIAFILCMVLVICNSVSILADTPAPEATTTAQQTKTAGENSDTKKKTTDGTENVSAQSEDSADTKKPSDEDPAPEVKTTEEKKETTEASTEKKEDSAATDEDKDDPAEVTTKAKEETEKADEPITETTTGEQDETKEAEESSTKEKEEIDGDSDKKDTEKGTEEEEKTAGEKPEARTFEQTVDGIKVIVSAADENVLPEDATLSVTRIHSEEELQQMEDAVAEDLVANEKTIKDMMAFDIKFMQNGTEIQPNGTVTVEFENTGYHSKNGISVYHVDDNKTDATNMNATTETEADVAFETTHFSNYVVINQGSQEITVTIEHYLDNGDGKDPTPLFRTQKVEIPSGSIEGKMEDFTKEDNEEYSLEGIYKVEGNQEEIITDNEILVDSNVTLKCYYTAQSGTYQNETTFFDYDITSEEKVNGSFTYNQQCTITINGEYYNGYYRNNALYQSWNSQKPSYEFKVGDEFTYYARGGRTYNCTWLGNGQYSYIVGTSKIDAGINSNENYSGKSNQKLAVGSIDNQKTTNHNCWIDGWEANKNNMAKHPIIAGLITNLSDENSDYKDVNFAVDEPGFFSDDLKEGKRILDGYKLQFSKTGNKYTLNSVLDPNGGVAENDLSNFWPLDNDLGVDGWQGPGDDNLKHNWYFGMRYDFEFSLGDYIGDLKYSFNGDDDLWVFLDGEPIIDLGGLHLAYPENDFVNNPQYNKDDYDYSRWVDQYPNECDLWEEILGKENYTLQDKQNLSEEERTEKHTITVLFMERGGFGSNCQMEFVLPNVEASDPIISSVPKATLSFEKINGVSKNGIPGAEFTLYSNYENGQCTGEIDTAVSGNDGTVSFNKRLEAGTYYMKETEAPKGYLPSDEVYTIEVTSDGTTATASIKTSKGTIVSNITNQSIETAIVKNKSAHVEDWDERTYNITLEASSIAQRVESAEPVQVVLVFDRSGSMNFRSSLQPAVYGTKNQLKDYDQVYYYILPNQAATVYRVWHQDGEWFYTDDSYWDYEKNRLKSDYTWDENVNILDNTRRQYYTTDDPHDRFYYLKQAANEFAGDLAEMSLNSELSLVTFTKEKNDNAVNTDFALQQIGGKVDDFKEVVNGLETQGGTQPSLGLDRAKTILNGQDGTKKQYVILLTDGCPADDTYENVGDSVRELLDTQDGKFDRTLMTVSVGLFDSNRYLKEAKDYLEEWASNVGDSEEKYAFSTDNADGLSGVFRSILAAITSNVPVEHATIKDYIDPRFEIINADGGRTGTDEGGTYVIWENQDINAEGLDGTAGWSRTIQVKAKKDYIGGNAVTTNGAGSGITVGDTTLPFDNPKVNVKVDLEVGNYEKTIFKGDSVADGITDVTDIRDLLFNVDYMIEQYNNPGDPLKEKELRFTWYEDQACSNELTESELQELLVSKPEENITCYLKVEYIGAGDTTPDSTTNTEGHVAGYDDGIPDTTTVAKNSAQQKYPDAYYGVYNIHVVSGQIQITKTLDEPVGTDDGAQTFSFNIQGPDGFNKTVSISIGKGETTGSLSNEDAVKLQNLARGEYTITENAATGYSVKDINTTESNCKVELGQDGKSVTFTLGKFTDGDEDKDTIQNDLPNYARGTKGVAAFTNEKVISDWAIKKLSSSDGNPVVDGAVFKLERDQQDGVTHKTYFGQSGADGVIAWYSQNPVEVDITNVPPVTKLEGGTYTLTELKTKDGYTLSDEIWTIEISGTGKLKSIISSDDRSTELTGTTEDGHTTVYFYYYNDVLYDLPSAGGPGIYWYTFSGTLLMAGAALIVYRQKRKREVLLRK